MSDLPALVAAAAAARDLPAELRAARRLFAGSFEGAAGWNVDLFGRTLVVRAPSEATPEQGRAAAEAVRAKVPRVRAALLRARRDAHDADAALLFGEPGDVDDEIREDGTRYALALQELKDGGLYLDTRTLRAWLKAHLSGARVLNAFAYTASLGVAARAGGASLVVNLDKSMRALDVGKRSMNLNGFAVRRADFRAKDFFTESARLRKDGALFDCVIVDPPFYAEGKTGKVDLEAEGGRLVDKARPLVADGGALVVVNNALWLPGEAWKRVLDGICAGGYAEIEALVPAPDDVLGAPATRVEPHALPTEPAPWAHPTKIAILRMRRKDGRR